MLLSIRLQLLIYSLFTKFGTCMSSCEQRTRRPGATAIRKRHKSSHRLILARRQRRLSPRHRVNLTLPPARRRSRPMQFGVANGWDLTCNNSHKFNSKAKNYSPNRIPIDNNQTELSHVAFVFLSDAAEQFGSQYLKRLISLFGRRKTSGV